MNPIDTVVTELLTVRDYIRWAASRFVETGLHFGHGTDNALDEAAALVLHTLHLPYELPAIYFEAILTLTEREQVLMQIQRRLQERKPVAYLSREAWFAGHRFYVDERVLVPRSPIAELIAASFSPWLDQQPVSRILDLCTGSGCIAIACAHIFPDAQVDAADLSGDALQVARINTEQHDLTEQVQLIQSDLYQALQDQRYDLIVSNPPYVSQAEIERLPAEYTFEPLMGFDGGISGLDCLKQILAGAGQHLTDNGILIVEAGCSAMVLQEAYPQCPFQWLTFENGGDGVFLLTAEQLSNLAF